MESYRIINFIMQSLWMVGHALFILALHRRRQPTPVWLWFYCLCIAMWVWGSGRFLESVVYLFFPGHNGFYQFAANYQYLGNTTAAACYVLWTLYLTGRERLASNRLFRAAVFAVPIIICTLVFTNPLHRLFYVRLDMGERVEHGPLFMPCALVSYLMVFAGWAISIRFVLRTGRDRLRQIALFSAFPLVPAIGALVRSLTGVDRLDYTSVLMAAAIASMYQLVFKYRYIGIISASIQQVIEQTEHPIGIYDPAGDRMIYTNRIAQQEYLGAAEQFFEGRAPAAGRCEVTLQGRQLSVDVVAMPGSGELLVTATDLTEIMREQDRLEQQIRELELHREKLDEARRNIDAYLDALSVSETLRRKQELVAGIRQTSRRAFDRVAENLETAKQDPARAETALRENLELTRDCIAAIRRTVAQLREG